MDRLYRNIKTGEEKILPEKVYQSVKTRWTPVIKPAAEPQKPVITDPADLKNLEILEKVTKEPLTQEVEVQTETAAPAEPTKEDLQSQYETLAGKKPDGRWSEKKLSEQIQELKETNK